jgi:hypothetical protein
MDVLTVLAAMLGGPAVVASLWYLSSRHMRRRRGTGRGAIGSILGITDEIFRPETHQAHQIQKIQHELPAPAPAPGDPRNPYSRAVQLPKLDS